MEPYPGPAVPEKIQKQAGPTLNSIFINFYEFFLETKTFDLKVSKMAEATCFLF
jgi:hypothetical protein